VDSDAYGCGDDRGGGRNVQFTMIDPEHILDTDWTQFKYPVAGHFVPRFKEAHAVSAVFHLNTELAAKFPVLNVQINTTGKGARAAAEAQAQPLAPRQTPAAAAAGSRIYEGRTRADEGGEGAKGSHAIPPARVDAVPAVRDRARHFAALPLYSPCAGGVAGSKANRFGFVHRLPGATLAPMRNRPLNQGR